MAVGFLEYKEPLGREEEIKAIAEGLARTGQISALGSVSYSSSSRMPGLSYLFFFFRLSGC